jgi:hypothetical protein
MEMPEGGDRSRIASMKIRLLRSDYGAPPRARAENVTRQRLPLSLGLLTFASFCVTTCSMTTPASRSEEVTL